MVPEMSAATDQPEQVETDVVICGGGSAGICAALWLARAGISFQLLERRSGPLAISQADGVQCRTVEIFDSFEIADELLREAYHVNELTFWDAGPDSGKIMRQSTAPDTPPGISHQPHVILNQARVNELMLNKLQEFAPLLGIGYSSEVSNVILDDATAQFPIRVNFIKDNEQKYYKAKYVLVSDGAHSRIRRSLSIDMVGDSSDAAWGVMDIYLLTDFPDIRKKSTIRSSEGALVIIPREGNFMTRFYLQMPPGTTAASVTLENLHARAKAILRGFSFDVSKTVWWSAYTIGQRVASSFDALDGRVFLAGDACHTHSPKAGQGMNVSLQDGYNIGWKLSQVLSHNADPTILKTYATERRHIAQALIDFDRRLTQLYHEPPENFQSHFLQSAAYMAGVTNSYPDTVLTSATLSDTVATGLSVGSRCPSAKVTRLSDARVLEFQQLLPSDLLWRLAIFPGDTGNPQLAGKLDTVCRLLKTEFNAIKGNENTSIKFERFVEPLLVLFGDRSGLEPHHIPLQFYPLNKAHGVRDTTRVFIDEAKYKSDEQGAYKAFDVDLQGGALVLIRPDQHVALKVLPENISIIQTFLSGVVP